MNKSSSLDLRRFVLRLQIVYKSLLKRKFDLWLMGINIVMLSSLFMSSFYFQFTLEFVSVCHLKGSIKLTKGKPIFKRHFK